MYPLRDKPSLAMLKSPLTGTKVTDRVIMTNNTALQNHKRRPLRYNKSHDKVNITHVKITPWIHN